MTPISPARGTRALRILLAVLRIAVALTVLAAVTATAVDSASRTPLIPVNFFGYFTIQGNLLMAAVLLITAAQSLAGRAQSQTMALVRGATTSYIIVVGLVYNTLLIGLAGGVTLPWANAVMHLLFPVYGLLDWIFFTDRPPLPWRRLWVVTIYPIVWLVVVLIRGATDGWVPYPFLSPSIGYDRVAVYVLVVAAVFVLSGAVVWALSRLQAPRARRD
ncbi:Pr6Pr family membrane protein [Rathayibacter festucae]|uniref:Pr6Pr family membrane protein n=1 Tax=Rathayibacter festucae TaxID=110937 RepID=UPI002A6A45FB|nr:Pr6Pr family membrane protein [Rathayibacter festucae]MDY0911558.1 Pr6Pr family membrane protein [Rathayibacter festucae]